MILRYACLGSPASAGYIGRKTTLLRPSKSDKAESTGGSSGERMRKSKARGILAEGLIVRHQLPKQIRHAAHARLSQDLPQRFALGDQFEKLGPELSYLLLRERCAHSALGIFDRGSLLSYLNLQYNLPFRG